MDDHDAQHRGRRDGKDQANAAAQGAAEEAVLRDTGAHLVHVKETSPDVLLPFEAREPDGSAIGHSQSPVALVPHG
ncbi:hypothetical protein [Streptomyces fradiae]|uniref:hypothetical protein n=1 Tax=Streptomyces fradiae TaxID=1906 RepID=UPI0035116209